MRIIKASPRRTSCWAGVVTVVYGCPLLAATGQSFVVVRVWYDALPSAFRDAARTLYPAAVAGCPHVIDNRIECRESTPVIVPATAMRPLWAYLSTH